MKEFISGTAMLMLLLIFPIQTYQDTANAVKINQINELVYASAEQARYEGKFTTGNEESDEESNIENLENQLKKVVGKDAEIKITLGNKNDENDDGTEVKYRRIDDTESLEKSQIHYKFEIPLGNLIGAASFLGLTGDDYEKTIIKEGYVYSEVLPEIDGDTK